MAFDGLRPLLDQHRSGDGFVSYEELSTREVKALSDAVNALSDAVNALSEPLSTVTAAVLS